MHIRNKSAVVLGLCSALCVAMSVGVQAQLPQPTEQHKRLEKSVGTWDAKMVMMGMEAKGKEVNKMICGGMFLSSDFSGEFNGMPFTGHGVYGYDPAKSKYTGFWIDNFSPAATISEGNIDKSGAMVMWAMMPNMATGSLVKTKMVDKFSDDTHRLLAFFQKDDQGEYQETMRIEYTKAGE